MLPFPSSMLPVFGTTADSNTILGRLSDRLNKETRKAEDKYSQNRALRRPLIHGQGPILAECLRRLGFTTRIGILQLTTMATASLLGLPLRISVIVLLHIEQQSVFQMLVTSRYRCKEILRRLYRNTIYCKVRPVDGWSGPEIHSRGNIAQIRSLFAVVVFKNN